MSKIFQTVILVKETIFSFIFADSKFAKKLRLHFLNSREITTIAPRALFTKLFTFLNDFCCQNDRSDNASNVLVYKTMHNFHSEIN